MVSPAASILSVTLAALAALSPVALDARDAFGYGQSPVEAVGEAAPGDDRTTPHEVARAPDGLFYVHATVNGQRVRFLVDTGASVVTLTAADARRLGVAPAPAAYLGRVNTVGGQTAMAWTRIDRFGIAGRELTDVRAAVVRSGLGVSLLGQNLLARLDHVSIDGHRLRLG